MKKRVGLISWLVVIGAIPGWAQHDSTAFKSVLMRYYAAIERHDYKAAYGYWKGNGEGSPRSLSAFAAGFKQTAHTSVVLLKAGRQEAAAGSVYVTIPVDVKAELKNGKQQLFNGTYTLRRINGPSGAKKEWYIYSAKLKPVSTSNS